MAALDHAESLRGICNGVLEIIMAVAFWIGAYTIVLGALLLGLAFRVRHLGGVAPAWSGQP